MSKEEMKYKIMLILVSSFNIYSMEESEYRRSFNNDTLAQYQELKSEIEELIKKSDAEKIREKIKDNFSLLAYHISQDDSLLVLNNNLINQRKMHITDMEDALKQKIHKISIFKPFLQGFSKILGFTWPLSLGISIGNHFEDYNSKLFFLSTIIGFSLNSMAYNRLKLYIHNQEEPLIKAKQSFGREMQQREKIKTILETMPSQKNKIEEFKRENVNELLINVNE